MIYETDVLLQQYLNFHYGNAEDSLAYSYGLEAALHFPIHCVNKCLDLEKLLPDAKALDLGCAVGRSSFELARFCQSVLGIDKSSPFINAAEHIKKGSLEFSIKEHGHNKEKRLAKAPSGIDTGKVIFQCEDAMAVEKKPYEVVLAANLLCRLPDPISFLELMTHLVVQGGQLILTTPFSWDSQFTPEEKWLNREQMHAILLRNFSLEKVHNLPFLIREHKRRYQWGVAEATLWIRR